ncbi:hypothetical protein LX64_00026 [Chitinophaga skermanii]|uniref:Uncharacterized protein n=1 Tax=Chitinophaga skermanii TaxID=331697 RepID=A0A327R3R5_9BACT|nr:PepSY-like domain-containing protein [Chitinophaga skermanii]RAJ10424.1 hypothetical protein LX64_00026 [Chitinophaga skermanii]
MKHILCTILLCGFVLFNAQAQQSKAPETVTTAFETKYPGIKASKWEKLANTTWQAVFRNDNKRILARFKENGKWLEEEYAVNMRELPQDVLVAIDRQHTGHTFKSAIKVNSALHDVYYRVSFVNGRKDIEDLYTPEGTRFTLSFIYQ